MKQKGKSIEWHNERVGENVRLTFHITWDKALPRDRFRVYYKDSFLGCAKSLDHAQGIVACCKNLKKEVL